jgi:hypothetical protein
MLALRPLLSSGIILLSLASAVRAGAATPIFQVTQPSAQMIYAPIAGLEEFADWQLAVVNRSIGPTPAASRSTLARAQFWLRRI